jgi:dihydroorotate dehydrogenase, subfamily 2
MYPLIRGLLFHLDPETAHEFACALIERVQSSPALLSGVEAMFGDATAQPRMLWGLEFRNPLGIAAGFDKNARLVKFLRAIGFGFVEVGTVTLRPQPGNPKPRMFRFPREKAIINRLGFNNEGAAAVAGRLESLSRAEAITPLFVNIGKNRDVALEDAPRAYLDAYRILAPLADATVINVSSPNTPGLRDLQASPRLEEILLPILDARETLAFARGGRHPVLLKIAPDLDDLQLQDIAEVCSRLADGMVATNTTISREELTEQTTESGGLSGRPLFARSTEILAKLRALVGRDYPLIGAGGVFSASDAKAKLDAGADLVQAYTGFIYEGPAFASRIAAGLR